MDTKRRFQTKSTIIFRDKTFRQEDVTSPLCRYGQNTHKGSKWLNRHKKILKCKLKAVTKWRSYLYVLHFLIPWLLFNERAHINLLHSSYPRLLFIQICKSNCVTNYSVTSLLSHRACCYIYFIQTNSCTLFKTHSHSHLKL
jgi:hypothetical protein